MKIVIIGLGSFGASLAVKLTEMGHEVIGVDVDMEKVNALKDKVTHTLRLDSTDPLATTNLPLANTDLVVIGIGEDEGANIMATALMKQMKVKRIISRSVSPLHETVLQAMGVDEIVHPEEETADRLAKKLNMMGVIDSFELTGDFSIVEAESPKEYIGKTLAEVGFRSKYNLVVLTTLEVTEEKNFLGRPRKVTRARGVASADTVLHENDILVLYGNTKDIKRFLERE